MVLNKHQVNGTLAVFTKFKHLTVSEYIERYGRLGEPIQNSRGQLVCLKNHM